MLRRCLCALCLPLIAAADDWILPEPPAWPPVSVSARIQEGLPGMVLARARWMVAQFAPGKRWIDQRAPAAAIQAPRQPRVTLAEPRRPCSVPLTNALKFSKSDPPMPQYRPDPHTTMPNVRLPAPPCEDFGQ